MCPPPSLPCATITSAPAATARSASSTRGTMCITRQPRSCALAKIAARSWSSRGHAVEKTSGSSARTSSTRSSVACKRRLIPIGFDVSSRTRRTHFASSSGGTNDAPNTPSAPASDTLPTSSPPVAPPPMPADASGCSTPMSSVNRVVITSPTPVRCPRRCRGRSMPGLGRGRPGSSGSPLAPRLHPRSRARSSTAVRSARRARRARAP